MCRRQKSLKRIFEIVCLSLYVGIQEKTKKGQRLFTCEKSGDLLTVNVSPEEDVRLCRIVNGDVEEDEDSDEDNGNDAGVVNDQASEQSLPRLDGVSLSGRRTTCFFLG